MRDAEHLEKFVRKMLKAPVEDLASKAALDEFVKTNPVSFVLMGKTGANPAFETAWQNASKAWQASLHFAHIQEVPSPFELEGAVAYSDGEIREVLPASKPEGMEKFVDDNHLPLVSELGTGSFYRVT